MKRKISSLALMFLSMAVTLHLTDSVARHVQEAPLSTTSCAAQESECDSPPSFEELLYSCDPLPKSGLGAIIEAEPRGIRLVSLLPGHAASNSGLQVGDRIIQVDDQHALSRDGDWAVRHLRGKIGTRVDLVVERGQGLLQKTFRTTIQRASLDTYHSVYSKVENDELVLRVLWLSSTTADQLAEHLSRVDSDQFSSIRLDLTNLSSGDVNSLADCASLFLPEGTLLGHQSNDPAFRVGSERHGIFTQSFAITDRLQTVEVGPYTGGVAELWARALADNLDVTIVGAPTAGLGTTFGRSLKSRSELPEGAYQLFDAEGTALEGNPLKPSFWSWSNLLSPVASGLE